MILHGRRQHRRRYKFGWAIFADDIADGINFGSLSDPYSILFDVDSGHGDHSGELPLFVGFVVD